MPEYPSDPCQAGDAASPPPEGAQSAPEPEELLNDGTRARIRRLPPEVGAVFLAVGVVGVIIPGPIGAPFLLAGGLVLMPNFFNKFEHWIEKKLPNIHDIGMRNVDRFIDNFERRFPPKG